MRVAQQKPLTLSFWNLLEVEVLSVMRRREGITMQRIRRALTTSVANSGSSGP